MSLSSDKGGGARLILIYQNRSALVVQAKYFDENILAAGESPLAHKTFNKPGAAVFFGKNIIQHIIYIGKLTNKNTLLGCGCCAASAFFVLLQKRMFGRQHEDWFWTAVAIGALEIEPL